MKAYSLYCEICNQSSKDFYMQYLEEKQKLKDLTGEIITWDVRSHAPEENEKFLQYSHDLRRSAIASLVFQALAIESYINLYGIYNLGNTFTKHYEKISTLNKLCILCRVISGKEFPKDNGLFESIQKLFKKRNMLVHNKAKSIDLKTCNESDFFTFLSKEINHVFEDLENFIVLYDQLKYCLRELDGSQYDIAQKQDIDINIEILEAINDMFTFR